MLFLAAFFLPLYLLLIQPAAGEDKVVKPIHLDKVNTDKDEDDPHPTSNGLVLYYSSNARGKYDIMVTSRTALTQAWPMGKPLEDYVQTAVDDRSVFATAEGKYPQFLYFATKKDKKINNFDLYVAVKVREGVAFSSPTPLNTVCTEVDELHPWLSADGRELFFTRKSIDGWRVFTATRPGNAGAGGFGEAKRIKELPPNFHHATLTPDGKTMYLQGPLEKGRWGLFRSTRTASGWGPPEPLNELNTAEGTVGDCSPCLSRDGTLLYFASDRPGGKGGMDLWAVRVEQLKK